MIRKECLTDDHLYAVAKRLKIREKQLLGRMVHALYLVEQLTLQGLQFTFKDGTCLSLSDKIALPESYSPGVTL